MLSIILFETIPLSNHSGVLWRPRASHSFSYLYTVLSVGGYILVKG